MSAVVIARQHGGPEVLQLVHTALPEPASDEVRISVKAAGVNPGDAKELAGVFARQGSSFPLRIGSEVAGVVSAIGPHATHSPNLRVGDEVVAFRVVGGYADEVIAPSSAVFPKPPNYSWPEAGALLHSAVTAFHMLEATRVASDDVVIVHGATGAVGSMLVQLARLRGATIVGTAAREHHDALRAQGVEPVEYGSGLADRLAEVLHRPATVALDASGADDALEASVALISDRDRIATIANYAKGVSLGVRLLGMVPGPDQGVDVRDAARAQIVSLAAAGQLRVHVVATFPLERAAEALALVADGRPGGKVVLTPA